MARLLANVGYLPQKVQTVARLLANDPSRFSKCPSRSVSRRVLGTLSLVPLGRTLPHDL